MLVFLAFFGLALCGMALKNLFFAPENTDLSKVEHTQWFNSALLLLGLTFGIIAFWIKSKQH